MYSLMSMRTIAFSAPKYVCATALASSVFPTPVGPLKMMLATGLDASAKPALARRMACEIDRTASTWPMTRLPSSCSKFIKLSDSSALSCCTGTPVHCATTSVTCVSSTVVTSPVINCTSAPASSMTSIALSGKNRSLMYRVESDTAAHRASSVKDTP